MDERLEKALAFSNYRITIENRKKAIKRRYSAMSVLHYENGTFLSDASTISFVNALLTAGHNDAIILDEHLKPINIQNLSEFKEKLIENYFEATNEYSNEINKLNKARDVKRAMDW
jgi:hypothetical protein